MLKTLEQLQASNKVFNSSIQILNSFDNLLEAINDYPSSLLETDRAELAKRALEGFSKALETDLMNNKDKLLTRGSVEYQTSNVAVIALMI